MKKAVGPLLAFLFVAALISPVFASSANEIWINPAPSTETKTDNPSGDEPEKNPINKDRPRAYIALDGFYSSMRGNFDGNNILVANDRSQAIFVPSLSGGSGIAVRGGIRNFTQKPVDFGLELKFAFSSHDWKQEPFNGKGTLTSFDGNVLLYFNTPMRVLSPYVSAGVTLPFLSLSQAAFSLTKQGNALYSGFGVNLGAGAEWMMAEHWALQGGLQYTWAYMTAVTGLDSKRFELDRTLALSVFSPRLSLAYYF